MNRRLIDPFQSLQLPEIIEEFLDQGVTTCLAFNRRGTILAAGTRDGSVLLWDWDTRGVASALVAGHESAVAGLSWSRNGRVLASVCNAGFFILWDVVKGAQVCSVALPRAAVAVSLTPRPPYQAVVSLMDAEPQLLDVATAQIRPLPMLSEGDVGGRLGPGSKGSDAVPNGVGPGAGAVARVLPGGDVILVGYAKGGLLTALDAATLGFLDVIKVSSMARILSLCPNRKGTQLLANCHDRIVRLCDVAPRGKVAALAAALAQPPATFPDLQTIRTKLQDIDFKAAKPGSVLWGPEAGLLVPVRDISNAVDRCAWADACFSADGEHIATAAASKLSHHIYIWDRVYGNMERILDGPKEGMGPLAWHPLRSCLCSVTRPLGRVYVWARAYAEQWSAFAPDFKELEENVEYVEQEDEFDWATPGATGHHDRLVERELQGSAALAGAGDSPELVDVLAADPDRAFSSDDEDPPGDQLHHLPVVIQGEEVPQAPDMDVETPLQGGGMDDQNHVADPGPQVLDGVAGQTGPGVQSASTDGVLAGDGLIQGDELGVTGTDPMALG